MTTRDTIGPNAQPSSLAELAAVLDTFGADRTRWPAPVWHALSRLIAENGEAQVLMREAEAFDRLLDQAPTLSAPAIVALSDKIGGIAGKQPRLVHRGAVSRLSVGRREHGFAAAALAASLLLGIIAGQVPGTMPAADLLIGSGTDSGDTSGQLLAQTGESESVWDEDIL